MTTELNNNGDRSSIFSRVQSNKLDVFDCVNARTGMNSAIAGYAAGVTGVVFGHPLDSAKVWLQTNTAGKNKHWSNTKMSGPSSTGASGTASVQMASSLKRPNPVRGPATASMSTFVSTSIPETTNLRNISRTIRALYSGVTGPLVSVGIVQSINFSTYDAMRRVLHRRDHPSASEHDHINKDSLSNVAISGFVAGTGLAFITSPLIRIKTRQQITGNGFRQAFTDTLFKNGRFNLSGCFVGIYPHLLSETVGRALYYAVYEALKRGVQDYRVAQGNDLSIQDRMVSAAVAGISCWSFIFPFDALRNRMYSQEGPSQLSTSAMLRRMYAEGALYRGFSLTVFRAGPVAAVVLPVYDTVLAKLSEA